MVVEKAGDNDGWIPWSPAKARHFAYRDIAQAIGDFEPVDREAGLAAARWLKEDAADDHPASVTWLYYDSGRIDGFFAIRSGNFLLSSKPKGARRRRSVLKPASEITWMCKHAQATMSGQSLLMRAASLVRKVAVHQGNIALVINPYDTATAEMLHSKHSFLSSARSGQLWLPVMPIGQDQ